MSRKCTPILANKKQKKCTPNTQPAKCTTFFPFPRSAKQIPQEISLYSPSCIKDPLAPLPLLGREVLRKEPSKKKFPHRPRDNKPQFQGPPAGKQSGRSTQNQKPRSFRKSKNQWPKHKSLSLKNEGALQTKHRYFVSGISLFLLSQGSAVPINLKS